MSDITEEEAEIRSAIAAKLCELVPLLTKDILKDISLLFAVTAAIGKAKFQQVTIPDQIHTFFYNIPLFTMFLVLEYSKIGCHERQDDSIYAAAIIRYYLKTGTLE